jgi:hypothetical protein
MLRQSRYISEPLYSASCRRWRQQARLGH